MNRDFGQAQLFVRLGHFLDDGLVDFVLDGFRGHADGVHDGPFAGGTVGLDDGAVQAEEWRAAKAAYERSLGIYQEMKSKGTLSAADASKPDEIASEIARCNAALL